MSSTNLLEMLQLITTTDKCWHLVLERQCASPVDGHVGDDINYGNAFPFCNDSIGDIYLPINRDGMTSFIVDTFITNPSGPLYPFVLVDKLKKNISPCWKDSL